MIYFISDTHFCHSHIIELCGRPFHSVHEMHQVLISNWNSRITEKDEVYILGDFLYKGSGNDANQILECLQGKKYLIRGNHDQFLDAPDFNQKHFEWVKDYFVLSYEGRKFILFHYPILEWQGFFGDSIHLYGHVHNSSKSPLQKARFDILGKNAVNVCVDANNFSPLSIREILRKAK
ncbi:MAG: metallophosphoesterase family protein [Saezia sp.]